MKSNKTIIGALLLNLLVLVSCSGLTRQTADGDGDTIPMRYAHNIVMVEHAGYIEVELRDPWDTTKVLHRYVLIEKRKEKREKEKHEGYTIVHVPLQKAAVFTAVHCALLKELGAGEAIGGVAEPNYIHLSYIKEQLKRGKILDIGNGLNPNLERIMQLQPDALMPSPFQNSGGYGRLEQIGIPIVECADYMENSPLARAEWMKFYGRLVGKAKEVDSLFDAVEKEYLSLKAKVEKASRTEKDFHRPTLMCETLSGAVWYTPAGRSTMGIMYRDAGADYCWKETKESGSLTLSLEAVMERALDAEFWLLKQNQSDHFSYEDLAADNDAYRQFRAFKERRVYACNTETSSYFEDTPFHPERLLDNLIQIFHPNLSISTKKVYFCPLNE